MPGLRKDGTKTLKKTAILLYPAGNRRKENPVKVIRRFGKRHNTKFRAMVIADLSVDEVEAVAGHHGVDFSDLSHATTAVVSADPLKAVTA